MAYLARDDDEENPYGELLKPDGSRGPSQAQSPGVQTSAPQAQGMTAGFAPVGMQQLEQRAPAGDRGVTGWTNYSQLYAANESAAKRGAGELADKASKAGADARAGVGKAWGGFNNAVAQGTLTGPQSSDYQHATGQQPFSASEGLTQAPSAAEGEWRAGLEKGAAGKYTGPDALSALDEYGKLSGQVDDAAQQVENLGSQGGRETLLEQSGMSDAAYGQYGGSRLDAMLLGSAGRSKFHGVEQRYGGLRDELRDANKASEGIGDAARAQSDQAAGDYGRLLDDYDAKKAGELATAEAGGAPTGSGYKPGGYDSYEDFLEQLAAGGGIHKTGMDLSLVDSLNNKLGEAGITEGQGIAEGFRNGVLGDKGDGIAGSLNDQNRHNAFQNIEKMYGQSAAKWLWQYMTEGLWKGMDGKNSGAMYKTLADLIEAGLENGSLVRGQSGLVTAAQTPEQKAAQQAKDAALTQKVDFDAQRTSGNSVTGPDGQSREMTPQQNYLRAQAEKEGWLDEWEKQFLSGVSEPVNPNGSTPTVPDF